MISEYQNLNYYIITKQKKKKTFLQQYHHHHTNKKMISSKPNSKQKNFKKKNINISTDGINYPSTDKFGDLKSKIQKQKQQMKKTGKRFREEPPSKTTQSTSTQNILQNRIETEKHQIAIGPDQITKQVISLKDISVDNYQGMNQQIKSSTLFDKQLQHQKKLSIQLHQFLQKLNLEHFADVLIQNGFEDLQTLADVRTEDLNLLMMRAPQQIQLLQAIKQHKLKSSNPKTPTPISKQQITNSSKFWKMKTQPAHSQKQRIQSLHILTQIKKQQKNKQQKQFMGLKPGSFLYSVGAKNWSVEDQIRRACSVCFKVEQQMEKKGNCYYCSNCSEHAEKKMFQIEMDQNMNRLYKRLEEQ